MSLCGTVQPYLNLIEARPIDSSTLSPHECVNLGTVCVCVCWHYRQHHLHYSYFSITQSVQLNATGNICHPIIFDIENLTWKYAPTKPLTIKTDSENFK